MNKAFKYFLCLSLAVCAAFYVFLSTKKGLKEKKVEIIKKESNYEIQILDWRDK